MVRNALPDVFKNTPVLTKRESGQLARNRILLTIAATSGIWLILDIYLFYSTGFMPFQSDIDDGIKMPKNRGNIFKTRNFEVINDSKKTSSEVIKQIKPRNRLNILGRLKKTISKKENEMEQVVEDSDDSLDSVYSRIDKTDQIKLFNNRKSHTAQESKIESILMEEVGLMLS